MPSHVCLNDFFSLPAKKILEFLFFYLLKRASYITNFVKVMINLIGNRTSCCPIWSVIILVIKQIGPLPLCSRLILCYHSYDYRPNWTPLSPVTITNLDNFEHLQAIFKDILAVKVHRINFSVWQKH